jgi:hypothetical protein
MTTELQIFLTILVALAQKSHDLRGADTGCELDPSIPWYPDCMIKAYDWVLLGFFIVNVPIAFVATVAWKIAKMREILVSERSGQTDRRDQHAVARHTYRRYEFAMANEEDTALLGEWVEKVYQKSKRQQQLAILKKTVEGRDFVRGGGGSENVVARNVFGQIFAKRVARHWLNITKQIKCPKECPFSHRIRSPVPQKRTHIHTHTHLTASKSPPKPKHTAEADQYYSKFDGGGFMGTFADMKDFYGGLEKLIGDCRKDVATAMAEEHTQVAESIVKDGKDTKQFGASKVDFVTSNYGVRTRPEHEWGFIVDGNWSLEMDAGKDLSTGEKHSKSRTREPLSTFCSEAALRITARLEDARKRHTESKKGLVVCQFLEAGEDCNSPDCTLCTDTYLEVGGKKLTCSSKICLHSHEADYDVNTDYNEEDCDVKLLLVEIIALRLYTGALPPPTESRPPVTDGGAVLLQGRCLSCITAYCVRTVARVTPGGSSHHTRMCTPGCR